MLQPKVRDLIVKCIAALLLLRGMCITHFPPLFHPFDPHPLSCDVFLFLFHFRRRCAWKMDC